MIVAQVADPLRWDRWPQAEALLRPSAEYGGVPVIEPRHALLVVLENDELIGCATVWQSVHGYFEVTLIGGRDHRRWISKLDEVIGAAAREAGAARIIGIGRRGWLRELKRLGWDQLGEQDGHTLYAREL